MCHFAEKFGTTRSKHFSSSPLTGIMFSSYSLNVTLSPSLLYRILFPYITGHKRQLVTISVNIYVFSFFRQSHPEMDIAATPITPTPTTPTTPLGTTPPSLDSELYTLSYFSFRET